MNLIQQVLLDGGPQALAVLGQLHELDGLAGVQVEAHRHAPGVGVGAAGIGAVVHLYAQ